MDSRNKPMNPLTSPSANCTAIRTFTGDTVFAVVSGQIVEVLSQGPAVSEVRFLGGEEHTVVPTSELSPCPVCREGRDGNGGVRS
jgi:hypothetical protein